MPKRFQIAFRNISKTFPNESYAWRKKTIRTSFIRTTEMALFALTSPFWNNIKFKKRLSLSKKTLSLIKEWNDGPPRPKIFLTPHYCYVEMIPHVKSVLERDFIGEIGAIFRPLNQKALDDWIKQSRERNGFRLLSRKKGFQEARNILKNNGSVGVLFDQRAGGTGTLMMSQGRLTSATELPAILAKESHADVYLVVARRVSFMKCQIDTIPVHQYTDSADITLLGNKAFDDYLIENKELAQDWLWVHDRWRIHNKINQRLNLNHKRSLIRRQMALFGWEKLPQKTKIWIRMPFEFDEFVQGLFFVHAVIKGRPDAEVTLIGPEYGGWILSHLDLDVKYLRLKIPFISKWRQHMKWREQNPDTVIILQKNNKTAIESISLGSPQTVGMDCNKGSRLFHHRAPIGNAEIPKTNFDKYFTKYIKLGKYMGLEDNKLNLDRMVIPASEKNINNEAAYVIINNTRIEKSVISILRQRSPNLKIHTLRFLKPEPVPTALLWPEIFTNFKIKKTTVISDQLSWILLTRAYGLNGLFIKNQKTENIEFFPEITTSLNFNSKMNIHSLTWDESQRDACKSKFETFLNHYMCPQERDTLQEPVETTS